MIKVRSISSLGMTLTPKATSSTILKQRRQSLVGMSSLMKKENGIGDQIMKTTTSFHPLKKRMWSNREKIQLHHQLHQQQVLKEMKAQVKGLHVLEVYKISTR